MLRTIGALIVLAAKSSATAVSGQKPQDATQPDNFVFQRDQSVYITAFHYEHDHHKNSVDPMGVGDYLAAELVRKEFEKSGIFRQVDKPSSADYVFVVYVHDRTVEGLAIAPARYSQTRSVQGGPESTARRSVCPVSGRSVQASNNQSNERSVGQEIP